MPTQVELRGDGPQRLAAVIKKAGTGWPVVARDIVDESVEVMLHVAQREAPANQGNLRNAMTTRVGLEGKGANQVIRGEVFTTLIYDPVMDLGRRPGAKQPPSSALELWVRRKLGVSPEDAKGVAYVVARSIKRKGIKGHQYYRKALDVLDRNMGKIANAALKRYEKKLDRS